MHLYQILPFKKQKGTGTSFHIPISSRQKIHHDFPWQLKTFLTQTNCDLINTMKNVTSFSYITLLCEGEIMTYVTVHEIKLKVVTLFQKHNFKVSTSIVKLLLMDIQTTMYISSFLFQLLLGCPANNFSLMSTR